METFFSPKSIAVVGASRHRGGARIMANLRHGFRGAVYPVNPNYQEIEGLPCYPSLEAVPDPMDLVIIFVPAPAVPDVVGACARKGVRRVMIQSAGFAEVGERGREIQHRCARIAQEAGIRIWGPNCMGLVDVPRQYFFTFMHPRIYDQGLLEGRISLVVQSGMLSAGFLDVMRQRSIGVAKVCSIGNKADVDECDVLEYLLRDEGTDAVALYLESIPRGRRFAEMAAGTEKPIVLLKGGRSEAGAKAALSHTFSLAGNSRLLDSVLRRCGVTLARDFYQMMDLAQALTTCPRVPSDCRTGVITFSGGSGILSCDLLSSHGLGVARFTESTRKALDGFFPDWMPAANPVDLFPAIERHGRLKAYEHAISAVLEDPGVDTLFIHYFAGLEDEFLDLNALKQSADRLGKTLVFWVLGREAPVASIRQEAHRCGIAAYGEISRAMEALSAAAQFNRRRDPVSAFSCSSNRATPGPTDWQPPDGPVMDEHDSKQLLKLWGIPVVQEQVVKGLGEATEVSAGIGFPLVMKGLIPGRVHKSESGLVYLGIQSPKAVADSFQRLKKDMGGRGRVLVQQQADKDFELMAGFIRDGQFGPCVLFGLGGTLAELDPDVAFALAPVDLSEALNLMGRIRGKALLEGYRGMPPLNKDLMADLLVRLSEMGIRYPRIEQVDINPVVVKEGVPIAVDATIVMKGDR